MHRASHGRFVTFEGGEGSGKSTQVIRLAESLRTAGLPVITTREPGGTPGAEAIRALLLATDGAGWDAETEALLHVAARRDHLVRVIRPALLQGTWVISDRFADSTEAYQGQGHGLSTAWLGSLHGLAVGDFRPDLTIILDTPPTLGLARAGARQQRATRYEQLGRDFHERVRAGFLAIATREANRCVVIDATATVEAVAAEVRAAANRAFGLHLA